MKRIGKKVKSKRNKGNKLLSPELIANWQKEFDLDATNRIIRNAIVSVGSSFTATDVDEARKIDHIFVNSLKVPDVHATDQEYSGRCWIFAGLNVFRHMVINALEMDGFEFSQTYLFFYDKLEKANMFLKLMIELRHEIYDPNDWSNAQSRYIEELLSEPVYDGGYWNMFANLVDKYGLVPKSAMPETFQSGQTEDMNNEINHRLRTWAHFIRSGSGSETRTDEELNQMKTEWVKQIHGILVKYLGHPPVNFKYSFKHKYKHSGEDIDEDGDIDFLSILKASDGRRLEKMTPLEFKEMLLPGLVLSEDYVAIGNYPKIYASSPGNNVRSEWNKCYEIKNSSNVEGGKPMRVYNLEINKLKEYASMSIEHGKPVWFAGDVSKGFDSWYSALDEKLVRTDTIFGPVGTELLDKGSRLLYKDSTANHAMTMVGVDYNESDGENKASKWQVENSWGYHSPSTPGLDGFLYMSDDWFTENVFEVIIHRKIVERDNKRLLNKKPIVLKPWDRVSRVFTSLMRSNVKPKKVKLKK